MRLRRNTKAPHGGSRSDPYEFHDLAQYNAEVSRGVVHTRGWVVKMALEQARFDTQRHPADEERGR